MDERKNECVTGECANCGFKKVWHDLRNKIIGDIEGADVGANAVDGGEESMEDDDDDNGTFVLPGSHPVWTTPISYESYAYRAKTGDASHTSNTRASLHFSDSHLWSFRNWFIHF